jgi:AraC-like DNA-binding protein
MDVLSDTLRAVRLSGAIFFNARFTAPWGYDSPPIHEVAHILAPGAERVIVFHMVTEGECFVALDDGELTRLVAGDVIVFPQGDAHRMRSGPGAKSARAASMSALLARAPRLVTFGGGGATTRLVCGYLACDARLGRMLLSGLPRLLRVNIRESDAGGWLEESLRFALSESRARRPGGAGVLAKLSELLFIEVLRLEAEQQQEERIGWLAGLRDRVVGAALKALHVRPAHGWTLEELARTAGASRSVLAERFQRLLGVSPMQYLTQWRMMLAANLLCDSDAQLLDIAMDVGYQTDTAFIRAFRREFGAPPAAWRRARAAAAA